MLCHKDSGKLPIRELGHSTINETPTSGLERFSSTKHLIRVDSPHERFDFRVQVNGDRMPFSCRKLAQL